MTSINININSVVFRNLTDMKISPQKLGKVLIDSWYHQPHNNVLLLCNIVTLNEKIAVLEAEITDLEHKKNMLKSLHKELDVQKQLLYDSKFAHETTELLQYLNKRIIYHKYDVDEVTKRYQDDINNILKYDPDFDVNGHIKRLKELNACIT